MTDPTRIAVVGAAGWAGSRHVEAFHALGARVVALVDPSPHVPTVARAVGAEVLDSPAQLDADEVYVFYGLTPNLGPIAEWGMAIDKRQLPVDTEKFQTSIPGIFAVGDINTYPGKKKLILSGFHEAALAAFAVQAHLHPDQKARLQYTPTSPIMHRRLGVEP